MNDIITIKTSSSFSTKRKVEINPKIIELLKNGEESNIMVILPKGRSIDDLEINKDGTLSTRIKDSKGKIINQASLIRKMDALSVILPYVIQFTTDVYDLVADMKNYLNDINDSEMEQCCDFINKVSNKIHKIICNETLKTAYLTELIRKKEFVDQNIKLIRKRIELKINELSLNNNYNETFDQIEKLSEYLDFCIELYAHYVFLETAIQGNNIYDDMHEIKSEVNLVYEQNNDRLLPLLTEFEKKVKSLADNKISNSQFMVITSKIQGWYNPYCAVIYNNECYQANYIRNKKMRQISKVDFEVLISTIEFIKNDETKYLIENNDIYEIET